MRHTKAIAAVAAVLIVAGGTSGAAASGAVKGPPSKTVTADAQKRKEGTGAEWLTRLAHRYGVTVAQLERALPDVKRELGQTGKAPTDPAVVALLAHDLKISQAKAEQLLKEVFTQPEGGKGKPGGGGKGKPGGGGSVSADAFISGLAKQLGVSHEKAAAAYAALSKLGRDHGGVDPSSAQFAAIAKNLGVTPKRLADVIYQVKLSLSGVGSKGSPASRASYKG
ncbi:hypothetical protein [Actinacidiphila oryziradicis]|uniref:Uncharacterized protein n=1 Tax=Actinacidiphila oryziradicis TaxID=2571141 RepID=A0A4U0RLX0_9ACTN|nr:hypothetical protein [Actinacidiphila oryziradicis]TJZ96811.1 hypothetical protein FCI23_50465 [Actinacidiphila oryziradicis]